MTPFDELPIENKTKPQPSILSKPHAAIPPLHRYLNSFVGRRSHRLPLVTSRRRCHSALSSTTLYFIKASRVGAADRILAT